MNVVGGNNSSNAILKIYQLVDEIIKKIPAAILNRLSGVSLICSFVYSSVSFWWYNANLNKAVIRRPM